MCTLKASCLMSAVYTLITCVFMNMYHGHFYNSQCTLDNTLTWSVSHCWLATHKHWFQGNVMIGSPAKRAWTW